MIGKIIINQQNKSSSPKGNKEHKKRLKFGNMIRKMYLCNVMIKLRQAKVYE